MPIWPDNRLPEFNSRLLPCPDSEISSSRRNIRKILSEKSGKKLDNEAFAKAKKLLEEMCPSEIALALAHDMSTESAGKILVTLNIEIILNALPEIPSSCIAKIFLSMYKSRQSQLAAKILAMEVEKSIELQTISRATYILTNLVALRNDGIQAAAEIFTQMQPFCGLDLMGKITSCMFCQYDRDILLNMSLEARVNFFTHTLTNDGEEIFSQSRQRIVLQFLLEVDHCVGAETLLAIANRVINKTDYLTQPMKIAKLILDLTTTNSEKGIALIQKICSLGQPEKFYKILGILLINNQRFFLQSTCDLSFEIRVQIFAKMRSCHAALFLLQPKCPFDLKIITMILELMITNYPDNAANIFREMSDKNINNRTLKIFNALNHESQIQLLCKICASENKLSAINILMAIKRESAAKIFTALVQQFIDDRNSMASVLELMGIRFRKEKSVSFLEGVDNNITMLALCWMCDCNKHYAAANLVGIMKIAHSANILMAMCFLDRVFDVAKIFEIIAFLATAKIFLFSWEFFPKSHESFAKIFAIVPLSFAADTLGTAANDCQEVAVKFLIEKVACNDIKLAQNILLKIIAMNYRTLANQTFQAATEQQDPTFAVEMCRSMLEKKNAAKIFSSLATEPMASILRLTWEINAQKDRKNIECLFATLTPEMTMIARILNAINLENAQVFARISAQRPIATEEILEKTCDPTNANEAQNFALQEEAADNPDAEGKEQNSVDAFFARICVPAERDFDLEDFI
jgi:hypothetical protein